MGLFSKIKKGIKKAAKAVSKAVNKATDAVADVVETVGNGIGDGLSWVGDRVPDGGALGWLGDVVSAATDFVGSVIKGVGAIIGGVLSGVIRILGGIFTLDWDGIVAGFGDILGGILGGLGIIVLKFVALVQVIFTVGRPRPLNDTELRLIRLVFHRSIATYNVRVVEDDAGLFSLNDRPFVLGDTIYLKGKTAAANASEFVHECVHIWQNQHSGSGYAADAVASQWWGAGYDWESEANADKDWEDFELEAQGESIEDVYDDGGVVGGLVGNGGFFAEDDEAQRTFFFNGNDWIDLANEATRVIRGETPWRLTALFTARGRVAGHAPKREPVPAGDID